MTDSAPGYRVGVDVGGTFTDVVAVDRAPRHAGRQGAFPRRRPRGGSAGRAPGRRSRLAGGGRPRPRHDPRDQRHRRGRPGRCRPDRHPGLCRHPRHRAPEPAPPLPPRPSAQARVAGAGRASLRGERAARPRRPSARSDGPALRRRGDSPYRGKRRHRGRGVAAARLCQSRPRGSARRAAARAFPLRGALEPGQSGSPGVRAHRDDGAERRGHAPRRELSGPARRGEAGRLQAAPVPLRRRDGHAGRVARAASRSCRLRSCGRGRRRGPHRPRPRHRSRHQLRHGRHHHRCLPDLRRRGTGLQRPLARRTPSAPAHGRGGVHRRRGRLHRPARSRSAGGRAGERRCRPGARLLRARGRAADGERRQSGARIHGPGTGHRRRHPA